MATSVINANQLRVMSKRWAEEDIQRPLPTLSKSKFSPNLWTQSVLKEYKVVRSLSSKVSNTIVKLITTHILSGLALHYYKRINTLLEMEHEIDPTLDEKKIRATLETREQKLISWIESDIQDIFQPLLQVNFIKTGEELEEFVDISYTSFYNLQKIQAKDLSKNQLVLFDVPYQYKEGLLRSKILPKISYQKLTISNDNSQLFPADYSKSIYHLEVIIDAHEV